MTNSAGKPPRAKKQVRLPILESAYLKMVRTFFLRADACGLGIVQVIRFFRLRGWRPGGSSGRTLPGGSRPQRRFPRLWTPPLRRAYREFSASLLKEARLVLFWMERVPSKTARRITGAITKMSGTDNFMARARQFMQRPVLDFTASPWQRVQR